MATGSKTVAVVSAGAGLPPDVVEPLTRGGFAVRASTPAARVPSDAVAVLVLAEGGPEVIAAFTRRCRAEAQSPRPVVWLFEAAAVHLATTGFDAGADVCLVRPVDPDVLVAQVNVLLRSYTEMTRGAAREANPLDLSERLARLFSQTDDDAALARRTVGAFAPTPPLAGGPWSAHWVTTPSVRGGVHTLALGPTSTGLRVALTTAGGLGATTGAAVVEAVTRFLLTSADPPARALTRASGLVRDLGLPDTSMIGATVGVADAGTVTLACGGHPPAVVVPIDGPARLWHGVGAFLGQTEAGYSDLTGELNPGERVLLLAGGAAADKRPDVRAATEAHRTAGLEGLATGVAEVVFTPADGDDGFTLLALGRTHESSGRMLAPTEPER